jgi:hypothetical protein
MAKQVSPLVKLRGTIDQINFYKSQDGYLAREKGGVDADRIKNDPKFRLTRLNGLEFGIGGKAAKLFRAAFKAEVGKAGDARLTSRLQKLMVAILQTDTVNDYGYRKVENGDPSKLNLFEFNIDTPLSTVFELVPGTTINRVTGQATITLPALRPQAEIAAPDGTSHYNIFAAVAAINFADEVVPANRQSTGNMVYDDTLTAGSTLTLTFTPNSLSPVFLLMGIEFMKIVNGKTYNQSKGLNALQVIAVNVPPPGL